MFLVIAATSLDIRTIYLAGHIIFAMARVSDIRTMLLAAHIVGAMTRTFEELASTIKIASEQRARTSPTRNLPNYGHDPKKFEPGSDAVLQTVAPVEFTRHRLASIAICTAIGRKTLKRKINCGPVLAAFSKLVTDSPFSHLFS